jgi:hypothetical protein
MFRSHAAGLGRGGDSNVIITSLHLGYRRAGTYPTRVRASGAGALTIPKGAPAYTGMLGLHRASRRIIEIEIKGIMRLLIIWVKAVLKEVRTHVQGVTATY